jgi:uncharacterized membrane protein
MNDSIIAQFLPLTILCIIVGSIANCIAREKGRNVTLWTILGLIPFLNIFLIWYFIGATNLKLESKLNEILTRLDSLPKD